MAISAGAELTLVASVTASAASTIDFTTGIDTTYDEYVLHFIGLRFSDNNTNVKCYSSTDGLVGPTYLETPGSTALTSYTAGEGARFYVSTVAGFVWLSHNTNSLYRPGNAAGESMSGIIRFYDPASTTLARHSTCICACTVDSGNIALKVHSVSNPSGDAIDSIRITISPGTVTGEARLYGVAKSI